MIKSRYMQLEQSYKYVKKITKKNKDDVSRKFSKHIDTIRSYFDDYKKRQCEMLNEALIQQEGRVNDCTQELERQMQKLENDGANLSTIEDNEDNVLACMNEMVDEMYRNQLKTNNDFNLDGLKIDVDFDDDIV